MIDIILRPIPAGTDICLWDPTAFDDCSTTPPPIDTGGGGVDSPFRQRRRPPLVKTHEEDDLEIIRILAGFLGHN